MMQEYSSVTQKGQVTIPVSMRNKLGLKKGEVVGFIWEKDYIKILPFKSFFSYRGALKSKKPFDIKKIREAVARKMAKRYVENP